MVNAANPFVGAQTLPKLFASYPGWSWGHDPVR